MITSSTIRYVACGVVSLLLAGVAAAQPPQPLTAPPPPAGSAVYPGTHQFTAGPRGPAGAVQTNDVTLNFPNADVHEVAKAILGDILGLNYAVDPQVQGTVTLETAQPVARRDVLPIFEESLRAAKLALIKQGDVYTVVALDKAKRQPQLLTGTTPGYGSEAIPLQFVNAVELKKLLDPLVPENAIASADASRNMLIITGTAGERRSIRDLVRQFDVNWMRGMSFALLLPTRTDMHVLLPELDAMVNGKDSPTAGLVRLVPIERLNGVLAISPQPKYLTELKKWVAILDRAGAENERKLFVYHVQNGKASDLATVLVGAFGGTPAQQNQSTTPNLTATGQSNSVQNYKPGFGFQGATGSSTGSTGFQPGMGGTSTGATGFQSGSSSFGSNTGTGFQSGSMGSGSNPGSESGSATGQQPAAIVSQTLLLPGQVTPISITSDDGNNSIVFYSTPRQYGLIQDALRQLDILPLQVLIEAAITEVTLTDKLQYGVEWQFAGSGGTATLTQGATSALVQNFPGFSYFVASPNGNIQAALNELSDVTHIKVLSAPKLMVLNNHTAALQVGDEVPVLQASTTSTLTEGVTNEVNYIDTGVILNVTPRVNDSGLVLLDLDQEVSGVVNTTSSDINSPTIQQRKIASSIAVKDGETIALGGLIKDNDTQQKSGLPWLNEIPGLGFLFGATSNEHDRTELLVLLTPRVIRNAQDVRSITDELRDKIHAAVPLPPARQ